MNILKDMNKIKIFILIKTLKVISKALQLNSINNLLLERLIFIYFSNSIIIALTFHFISVQNIEK